MPISMSRRKGVFYSVVVLFPVLFFVLLETALRAFNYGYDYTEWITAGKGRYVLNGDIAHKYFYNVRDVPSSDLDTFDKVKKPNAFRVFVLGGSAAAGFPYLPIGSFSRYLQHRLALEYPRSRIEVINCAMTAVNSYTLLDLLPGILREKPDLLLIYAGNNEYYGALGIGSMESFGTSGTLIKAVLYLEQFRTFQLIRNIVRGIEGLFVGKHAAKGTLMSRMARNQYIPLGSKVYREGLQQFKDNMTEILRMTRDSHVPVILGTLACNMKDQYPFVSVRTNGMPPADSVFMRAKRALARRRLSAADSLFRYAKNLDALRFRPPTALNREIVELGKEFRDPVVNVDSVFNALSPDGIAGDNLMVDHLHPTLRGQELIGKLYYDEMEKSNLLPQTRPDGLDNCRQDSMTVANFPFTRLDSMIAAYWVASMKDDWPFIEPKDRVPINKLLKPEDHIDSLAFDLVTGVSTWTAVHWEAAEWYVAGDNYSRFVRVMNVLISEFPVRMKYYDYAAAVMLHLHDYERAYRYLSERDEIQPDAFSEKWLGIIDLTRNRIPSAGRHLAASLKYDDNDPQVWYNLSGVYLDERNYAGAKQAVAEALVLRPDFPQALALRSRLQGLR